MTPVSFSPKCHFPTSIEMHSKIMKSFLKDLVKIFITRSWWKINTTILSTIWGWKTRQSFNATIETIRLFEVFCFSTFQRGDYCVKKVNWHIKEITFYIFNYWIYWPLNANFFLLENIMRRLENSNLQVAATAAALPHQLLPLVNNFSLLFRSLLAAINCSQL